MIRYGRKTAYVYAVLSPAAGHIKIGMSRLPNLRMADLQWAHGSALELLASMEAGFSTEKAYHKRLEAFRLCGEWFLPTPEVMEVVSEIRALGEKRREANRKRQLDRILRRAKSLEAVAA